MNENEEKLKRAAELFVQKEGEGFLAETGDMYHRRIAYLTPRADRTVRELAAKNKKKPGQKLLFGLCAAAACVLIVARLSVGTADPMQAGPAEMLPLTFALPADYRVADTDFDNGMSIYSLESDRHGDVVLTMHYEEDKAGPEDPVFDEVIIDGTPVSAKVTSTYMLLLFEKDGVSYTLSSKDDLGSLAALYRSIVEAVPA